MIAASARLLGRRAELLRRRRAAEYRVQPRAAHRRSRAPAGVRVGRVRRASRTASAVDRRPDARDRVDRRDVDVRAVRLLPPGGADRRRIPRRRADRSVRQPQHDGDRRLRIAEGSAARAPEGRARSRSTPGRSSSSCGRRGARSSSGSTSARRRDTAATPSTTPHADGRGSGPTNVVTDLGTYGFDDATGEMTLRTMHPGVTLDDVRANTGWEPRVADDLGETPSPSDEELRLIREELDPGGVYTK